MQLGDLSVNVKSIWVGIEAEVPLSELVEMVERLEWKANYASDGRRCRSEKRRIEAAELRETLARLRAELATRIERLN